MDDAWRDSAREALREAIGAKDAVVLVDSIDGAPPAVTVSLAIAAPQELVPILREHALFIETVAAVRSALARVLPETEVVLRLVPAAIETTNEMLGLALDVAGRSDIAEALSLPPSSERDPEPDGEEGRSLEVTTLRIRQIEVTALRRFSILQGRALPLEGELLSETRAVAAQVAPPARESSRVPALPPDGSLDWFPARSLTHETAKPRFWLVAQLSHVVSVRKGQRMRSLSERRYEHRDETRARRDFERRIAEKLAAGWTDMQRGSLETAILHHEPLVPEMSRDLVRTAARVLLARDDWGHPLSAQALVRVLGTGGDATDRELAAALVARIEALSSP